MSKKLKTIATKLSPSIKSKDFVIVLQTLGKYRDENSTYFSQFTASDMVKIALYVFSIKNFGDVNKGDELIEKSYVGTYFWKDSQDVFLESCERCGGSGYISCDNCGGDSRIECSDCDGSGSKECEDCDGVGHIDGEDCESCEGRGEFDCSTCGGDGQEDCDECNVNGELECENCDGTGEMEIDETKFIIYSFITWDSEIIEDMYNSLEMTKPLYNDEILDVSDSFFVMDMQETHQKFESWVEDEKKYCFNLSSFIASDDLQFNRGVIRIMDFPSNFGV